MDLLGHGRHYITSLTLRLRFGFRNLDARIVVLSSVRTLPEDVSSCSQLLISKTCDECWFVLFVATFNFFCCCCCCVGKQEEKEETEMPFMVVVCVFGCFLRLISKIENGNQKWFGILWYVLSTTSDLWFVSSCLQYLDVSQGRDWITTWILFRCWWIWGETAGKTESILSIIVNVKNTKLVLHTNFLNFLCKLD